MAETFHITIVTIFLQRVFEGTGVGLWSSSRNTWNDV